MSRSANTIVGDADLLSEILLYLPAKPLIRFKTVSKQWLSLISSPYFCHRHVSRNPHSASGILYRRTPGLSNDSAHFDFISTNGKASSSSSPLKSLKFVEDPGGIKILQSCNGLLCCCSSRVIDDKRNYYIYNPTTNQHLILPRFIDDDKDSTNLGVYLAFDPRKSPDYKVICFRSCTISSSSGCRVEIYSSESKNWRRSEYQFFKPYGMLFSNGVFSNGAIHWIDYSRSMIYYDIDKERLSINSFHILGIDYLGGGKRYRYLGESCDHLHLLEVQGSRTTQFKVYEMQTNFRNWQVKYVVDLDEIVSANPQMVQHYLDYDDFYYAFSILTIVREEDEDNSSLLLHIPGKIVAYKFKDKSFKIVRDLTLGYTDSKGSLQYGCFDAYQYIETLACVC